MYDYMARDVIMKSQWWIQNEAFEANAQPLPPFGGATLVLIEILSSKIQKNFVASRESALLNHLQLSLFVPLPLPAPESALSTLSHSREVCIM